MRHDNELGHKLGPRLAELVTNATIAARLRLGPHEARVRQAATQELIDRAGREVADLYRPLIEAATSEAHGTHHPLLTDFLTTAGSGRHQWQAISGLALGGVSGALGSIFNNGFAGLARELNSINAISSPDQNTAAALAAAGIVPYDTGAYWAAGMGYPGEVFQALYEFAQHAPDLGVLQDLVNRGLMPPGDAEAWLRRQGYAESVRARLLDLREALLAPADAALAVLRGNMTHAEGVHAAGRAGVPPGDFEILIGNTGEPLALESLLEARRRGFIDNARLDKGIRQSRIRNEWIDVAHALEFAPMSTADAVEAAVQGHLTIEEAKQKAHENGLEPGDFQALYDTAGEPLSRTEMEQLYNRGHVTRAQVDQALRESRIKNKYVPLAFLLHERLPEPRQIVSGLTHGALTKEQAAHLLAEWGFAPASAEILIREGTSARLGTHHALTIAQIRELYAERIFTKDHTTELLHGLGYDDVDSAYLIALWDLLAGAAVTRQAVGVVRSRYVARVITATEASNHLDGLGIAATARDEYLKIWGIEREATVRVLTEAQIVAAHKKSLIDGAEALLRLTSMGYADDDAHILLGVAPGQEVA